MKIIYRFIVRFLILTAFFLLNTHLSAGESGGLTEIELGKIRNAIPDIASASPKQKRKVLILSPTLEKSYKPVACSTKAIAMIGRKTGAYEAVNSRIAKAITTEFLDQFDALCLVHCNDSEFLEDESIRSKIINFMNNGKGIASFRTTLLPHSFSPIQMPAEGRLHIKNRDLKHPINSAFGGRSFYIEEVLNGLQPVQTLSSSYILLSISPQQEPLTDEYAVSYILKAGKGRFFYSGLGGKESTCWNRQVIHHFMDGIQYAIGDLDAEYAQ